jgi:hypothetical protein
MAKHLFFASTNQVFSSNRIGDPWLHSTDSNRAYSNQSISLGLPSATLLNRFYLGDKKFKPHGSLRPVKLSFDQYFFILADHIHNYST